MKTNDRLLLTAVLFVGLTTSSVFGDTKPEASVPPLLPPPPLNAPAQDANPAPVLPPPAVDASAPAAAPEMGAPAAAKPAATHAKKKSTKTAAKKVATSKTKTVKHTAIAKAPEISMPLKPGAAEVTAKRVNLRGQPTIASEVLGRLTNGEPVTVIEELRRNNKRADDPDVWAKIALPAGTHTWIHATFVDSNKVVTVKKLNLRGGPGENFSVVGQLKKGDSVTQLSEKEGWLEIAPPADAYVYVAAAYLRQDAPMVPVEQPAAPVQPEMTPVPSTVAETAPVAPAPSGAPAVPPGPPEPAPTTTPDSALASSPAMPAPNLPMILDPSIKRIVDREGMVRHTWSIQAPSDYRLVSPDTGENVVYLHTTSTNLDLSRYKGLHIIATGEEGMDRRWKNTPVLTIRRIQVIE